MIHFGYYLTLAGAYRTGDLSFAYPLMRGTAPLLVALLGIVLLRELPTLQVAAGIVLISRGHRQHRLRAPRHGIRAPRSVGRSPTPRSSPCYTLVDGAGARASGNALGLRVLADVPRRIPVPRLDRRPARPPAPSRYIGRQWRARARSAAPAASRAYAIVLWAMTRAPVAAVAALRETSVLFAALIGALILKEGFGWRAPRRRRQRRRWASPR